MQPDAEALRWGTMKTSDGRAIERLASIVLHCQGRERLSLRDAAAQVLDRLAEFPAINYFETAPAGGPAELIGEGRVWQRASNGRAAGQAQHRGAGNFATMGGELMADKPAKIEARSKARPARAELRGVSGLLAWLRLGWADRAIAPPQLDSHGGRIAIPALVAWALFGIGAEPAAARAALRVSSTWGTLKATDAERSKVAPLADVVRWVMDTDELEVRPAAARVLDLVQAKASALYLRVPGEGVRLIEAGDYFELVEVNPFTKEILRYEPCFVDLNVPHVPFVKPAEALGPGGAIAWLRDVWLDQATERAHLDAKHGGELAILERDAVAMFGYVDVAAVAKANAPAAAVPAADAPGSGSSALEAARWSLPKHVAGTAWTAAEKAEMLRLRSVERLTDAEIAALVGTKRQTIGQVIGSRRPRQGGGVVGITKHLAR